MLMLRYSPRVLRYSKGIKMGMTTVLAIFGGVALLVNLDHDWLVWLLTLALVVYGVAEFILLIEFFSPSPSSV